VVCILLFTGWKGWNWSIGTAWRLLIDSFQEPSSAHQSGGGQA
jgi:hypothetical protein